jgi:hypothetical protein
MILSIWGSVFSKPTDMFDRDEEWAALSRFAADGKAGATLGVVSGRRRQGKTFLLDALCKASDGFFLRPPRPLTRSRSGE